MAPVRPGGHCIRRRDNYEGSRKKYSTATVGLEQEQLINVERRSSCKSPWAKADAASAAGYPQLHTQLQGPLAERDTGPTESSIQ